MNINEHPIKKNILTKPQRGTIPIPTYPNHRIFFCASLLEADLLRVRPGEAPDAPTVPEGWAGERQRRWQGFRSGACRVCQPRKCRTARLYVRTQLCHYVWMICIYIYVCVCIYVCMYVRMYVCVSMCLQVCMSVCLYVYMCVYLYVCVSECMPGCVYVNVYVHVHCILYNVKYIVYWCIL